MERPKVHDFKECVELHDKEMALKVARYRYGYPNEQEIREMVAVCPSYWVPDFAKSCSKFLRDREISVLIEKCISADIYELAEAFNETPSLYLTHRAKMLAKCPCGKRGELEELFRHRKH